MKTLISKIIAFFVSIWIFLFGKKEEPKPVAKRESVPEIVWGNNRKVPVHNNRKNTRGRYTQYVIDADGSRPIYHSAKA